MKFPSLVKLPKYNKFNFEPRYYDPVKEEVEMRAEGIRREMEAQKRLSADDRANFKAELEKTLKRRAAEDRKSNVMQITFILLFVSIFVGYYYYGNNVVYGALILIPIYILYRSKTLVRKKE